jgi:hypothetical protein
MIFLGLTLPIILAFNPLTFNHGFITLEKHAWIQKGNLAYSLL